MFALYDGRLASVDCARWNPPVPLSVTPPIGFPSAVTAVVRAASWNSVVMSEKSYHATSPDMDSGENGAPPRRKWVATSQLALDDIDIHHDIARCAGIGLRYRNSQRPVHWLTLIHARNRRASGVFGLHAQRNIPVCIEIGQCQNGARWIAGSKSNVARGDRLRNIDVDTFDHAVDAALHKTAGSTARTPASGNR